MFSFVYFDLGGVVILDLNRTGKWVQFIREIGIKPDQDKKLDELFDKYEPKINVGRDAETLIPIIEKEFGLKFLDGYSFTTDLVNHFEVNKSIWPVIDKIHKKCKVGLLTNMYPHMLKAINKHGIMPNVNWDVVIDSSVEGVKKPDPEIYILAEKRAKANGKELLFIDDKPESLKTAKDRGWQTFLYDSNRPNESSSKLSILFDSL